MKTLINQKSIWLNYHHLYYFMTVALEGSLAAASKKLSMGQPALSIQLKQFEAAIGIDLFERSKRKLELTENGKIALEYAKEIFKFGNELLETLHDRPSAKKVHVQIGALDTIPKHLVLNLAKKALEKKECSIAFLEGKSDELMRELTQHRIDLMVTNQMVAAAPGLVYTRKIARLPLYLMGGRSFLKLKKYFPNSLSNAPLVLPTMDNRVRHEFDHYCKLRGLRPEIVAEAQDVMVQKLMGISEVGLIVVSKYAAQEYLDRKELFVIGKLEDVYEELFLVSASRKIENPVAKRLMQTFSVNQERMV